MTSRGRKGSTGCVIEVLPESERSKLRRSDFPSWTRPMLATLTHEPFSDPGWIFERKLDGERCLAFRSGDEVRLMSRNRKNLNETYPELVRAIAGQSTADFVVDGEVVAFEGNITSFSRLQGRMHVKGEGEVKKSRVAVYYYLFDIVFFDGCMTDRLSLRCRKSLLKRTFSFDDPLRYTQHRNERGERYYREACRKGWEGLIAKDAGGRYEHGRSRSWLKFKCSRRQEFVVVGFTDPGGERIGFGALLVGYHEDDELRYAGKVGTGYDDETLRSFSKRLSRLERKTPPVEARNVPREGIHWVRPKLVVEVAFTEWTDDGKLRHPRYLGERRDKKPKQVVREDTST